MKWPSGRFVLASLASLGLVQLWGAMLYDGQIRMGGSLSRMAQEFCLFGSPFGVVWLFIWLGRPSRPRQNLALGILLTCAIGVGTVVYADRVVLHPKIKDPFVFHFVWACQCGILLVGSIICVVADVVMTRGNWRQPPTNGTNGTGK